MKKYIVDFEKRIWGYAIINAESKGEAEEKFDAREFDDEVDNKSDYEFEELREDK